MANVGHFGDTLTMFSTLLDVVDKHCPESRMHVTPERHKVLIDDVLPWLSIESKSLFGASRAILGESIFETSEIGFEYHAIRLDDGGTMDLPISLGSMYARSERKNRTLSLDLTVARGFSSQRGLHPASVAIEMHFCDLDAKAFFEAIYKDYRAQVCRLLERAQIEFFTSYCSDIVGKSKSKKLSALLDEYFSDPEVDNCFTLSKSCPRGIGYSVPIRAFLALSVLYAACRAALSGKAWRPTFEKNLQRLV
jgi:hypothetical protein